MVYTIITEGGMIQMKIKVNGKVYKWNGKKFGMNILKAVTFLLVAGYYGWLLGEMLLVLINR